MVHHFFFKIWTFEKKFEVFLKSPQMNTICGQYVDLKYPLLTDLVSVAQVWRLASPCCVPVAYSWIIHASVAVQYLYLQYLFLFGKYRKRCAFSLLWPFSVSYLSILSIILSVPSSFNDVFHHFLCVTKYFFSCAQKCLSLPHSSSRDPLRPPRLGPDAKACRRAHRSRRKPGATLAPESHITGTVNPYFTISLKCCSHYIRLSWKCCNDRLKGCTSSIIPFRNLSTSKIRINPRAVLLIFNLD